MRIQSLIQEKIVATDLHIIIEVCDIGALVFCGMKQDIL